MADANAQGSKGRNERGDRKSSWREMEMKRRREEVRGRQQTRQQQRTREAE
jgi:hypothetical protein